MMKKSFSCAWVVLFAQVLLAQVAIRKPIMPPLGAETPSTQVSSFKAPEVPPERVVLTVGNIKLTAAQFDAVIESIPEQFRAAARSTGRKPFAENIAKMLVLAQEGKRLKVDQTETFKMQEEFQTMNHMAAGAFTEISNHAQVDDATLKDYYEKHKAEYEQVHARHILIRTTGSVAPVKPGAKELNEEEALKKTEELRKQLLAGADFAKLAEKESDDPASAAKGGELEVFGHGQMVPAFDQAVFALKIGEISEPVRTPFGYHLIRVESKEAKPLSEVRAELEKELRPKAAQKVVDDLQSKASIIFDSEFFAAPQQVAVGK